MQNSFFNISKKLIDLSNEAMSLCESEFKKIDSITEYNQQKVLKAFIDNGVSESHFTSSTGYGYDDRGRDTLDKVFASSFGAEDALVRHNFVSGTHTLTVALFGILRPGDTMLCITGLPYDTLRGVIGIGKSSNGSLKEFGINYEQIDLNSDGTINIDEVKKRVKNGYKMVYIQRSRGYTLRPSLSVKEIGEACDIVHSIDPNCIVMVDNCYGEFVEKGEPLNHGADLIAGSLIKNPGGGIAPTGGYIAGRKNLVEMCSYRLTTPGTGKEIGATLGQNRELFMGIFHAPHVTGEALKTAVFTSCLFELLGFYVTPKYNEPRFDITQVIQLGNHESLIAFCQGIQKGAPVDSFVTPEPWDMPGYDNQVIMAAGAFTLGSSIELSADAPLREPYAVWMQGGLNFHSGKLGVLLAAESMLKKNLLII